MRNRIRTDIKRFAIICNKPLYYPFKNHGIGLEPISCDLENQYSIRLKLTTIKKKQSR